MLAAASGWNRVGRGQEWQLSGAISAIFNISKFLTL
jgi:hypothetical protein